MPRFDHPHNITWASACVVFIVYLVMLVHYQCMVLVDT
jgi:hypothetical protein